MSWRIESDTLRKVFAILAILASLAVVLVCACVNVSIARADDNNPEPYATNILIQSDNGNVQALDAQCTEYNWQDSFDEDVPENAEVVIDIAEVADGATCLIVNSSETSFSHTDRNNVKSVSFINPGDVTELQIGGDAFYQWDRRDNNALASVIFPDGLKTLNIGDGAFYQWDSDGNNALASVIFPDGLETLNIGVGAFFQWNDNGNNALADFSFPDGLTTLNIGYRAFFQHANGNNALRNFIMPYTQSDIDKMDISLGSDITHLEGNNVVDVNEDPEGPGEEDPNGPEEIEERATAFAEDDVIHVIDGALPWKWYGTAMSADEMKAAWDVANGYTLEHIDPYDDALSENPATDAQNDGSVARGLAETGIPLQFTLWAMLALMVMAGGVRGVRCRISAKF